MNGDDEKFWNEILRKMKTEKLSDKDRAEFLKKVQENEKEKK